MQTKISKKMLTLQLKKNFTIFILSFSLLTLLSGCGIYSFSGISLGTAKTVSIDFFENVAPIVNPNLSQTFTEEMKDKFVSQTSLVQVNRDGDLQFSGKIVGYETKPMDIQAGETAAMNRLTITVKVKFVNTTDDKYDFDRNFSWYEDYESSQNLADVESELTEKIVEKLVEDIFNASVVNW